MRKEATGNYVYAGLVKRQKGCVGTNQPLEKLEGRVVALGESLNGLQQRPVSWPLHKISLVASTAGPEPSETEGETSWTTPVI